MIRRNGRPMFQVLTPERRIAVGGVEGGRVRLPDGVVPLCLTEGCEYPSMTLGVCYTCRQRIGRLVKQGKTTWEQLEQEGKLLPPKKGPRAKKPQTV